MRTGFYRGRILGPSWLKWLGWIWRGKTIHADGTITNHILGYEGFTGQHAVGGDTDWILYPQFGLMDRLWETDHEYVGHLVGTPVWFTLRRDE